MFTIKTTTQVEQSQVESLLASIMDTSAVTYYVEKALAVQPSDKRTRYASEYPLRGGYIDFWIEGTKYRLTKAKIAKGLQVMADKEWVYFHDIISDNADAETADVFLQCCLLGKVIYG